MNQYIHWYAGLKIAQYLRPRYFIVVILYNLLSMLYLVLKLPLLLFMVLVIIMFTALTKINQLSDIRKLLPNNPQQTSNQIHIRINRELSSFCWLVNKWTNKCYYALISLVIFFWFIERTFGMNASWWLFGNLIVLYDSLRRYSKSLLKYALNLYKDY